MKVKFNVLKFYMLLTLVLPIVNNYRLLPVAFTYIYGIIGFLIFLYSCKAESICIRSKHFVYVVYVFIVALILYNIQSDVEVSAAIMRLIYFALIFINFYIFAPQIWEVDYCLQLYKKICLIVSMLIIVQYVASLFGHPFSLILPNLIANTGERVTTNSIIAAQISANRFSTFFLEPAHQAQYTIPCIVLLLFKDIKNAKRTDIILPLIMTIAMFATTSMQGILSCGIIWIIYLVELSASRGVRKLGELLFLIFIIVLVLMYLLQQPIIQEQIQKKILSFNHGHIYQGTSMYRRLIYGWECFFDMDWSHKIFGCGYDNAGTYLLDTSIGTKYVLPSEVGYMSGLSKMFVELGITGTLLNLSIAIIPVVRKMKSSQIILPLVICWFIIMLTGDAFDATSSLIPMVFALSFLNGKNKYLMQKAIW